jgi:hypothetical protein
MANVSQMFAVITSKFCTKTMLARIEEHPDCTSKIEGDPFALLDAIKTLTHDPLRAQYFLAISTNSMARMVNIHQGPTEPTINYTKRFKQESDVFESFYGNKVFHHLIEQQPEFRNESDPDKQDAMKKGSFKAWGGYHIINCADPARYGMLQKQLQSQFSLGQNQHPDSPKKGTNILSNHMTDAKYYEIQKRNCEKANAAKEEEQAKMTSFAQQKDDWICCCCGKKATQATIANCVTLSPRRTGI